MQRKIIMLQYEPSPAILQPVSYLVANANRSDVYMIPMRTIPAPEPLTTVWRDTFEA